MASVKSSSPMGCWALMSSPSGSARSSVVFTSLICLFARRSPDCALEKASCEVWRSKVQGETRRPVRAYVAHMDRERTASVDLRDFESILLFFSEEEIDV